VHDFFLKEYSNLPKSRYVHILLSRTTQSEAIFRTEGTGEPLSRETTALHDEPNAPFVERIVITKRKQIAPDRRTGRELLRDHDLLRHVLDKKGKVTGKRCLLNSDPCGYCVDCLVYGYAVGSGGAQRSRVYTEDAYSLLPASEVVDSRTGNATFDNGTMRHPETQNPSQALFESEYVKPEVIFLDVQTLKDVQPAEFAYVLGNIMRTSRYGAVGTRVGRMENRVLALAFSHHEVLSNLEWTQRTTSKLTHREHPFAYPLGADAVKEDALTAAEELVKARVWGPHVFLKGQDLETLLAEVRTAYEKPEDWLKPLAESFKSLGVSSATSDDESESSADTE
jgi:CRISPR-associated protein Csc2